MIAMALFAAQLGYGQGTVALSSLAGLAGGLWLLGRRLGIGRAVSDYRPVMLRCQRHGERTIEFNPETKTTGANHE
jgi:hypothetical protein